MRLYGELPEGMSSNPKVRQKAEIALDMVSHSASFYSMAWTSILEFSMDSSRSFLNSETNQTTHKHN
jgi:hypothetical protein